MRLLSDSFSPYRLLTVGPNIGLDSDYLSLEAVMGWQNPINLATLT